jgi:hypothetical protein
MIFVERCGRVVLFYMFLGFFFNSEVFFFLAIFYGFSAYEDEDWFEDPDDYFTYSQGEWDNDIELLECEFFKVGLRSKKSLYNDLNL